jgi:hypothetical protein
MPASTALSSGVLSSGFCNWRIDFTYADTNNKKYRMSRGRDAPGVQDRSQAQQLTAAAASLRQDVYASLCQQCAPSGSVPSRYEVSIMTEEQGQHEGPGHEVRLRRAGSVAFLVGLIAALAFFAFFPGMSHVIDWGSNSRLPVRGYSCLPGLAGVESEGG